MDDYYYYGYCESITTEAYFAAYSSVLFNATYEETIPPICSVDYSPTIDNGAIDPLLTACNDAGGDLYMMSFGDECGINGTTYYIDYPECALYCEASVFEFIFEEGSESSPGCTFTSFDGVYVLYNDEVNDTLTDDFNDVCPQVLDEAYNMALISFLSDALTSCEDDNKNNCTLDFTGALEESKDELSTQCNVAGGDFFIGTYELSCGGGAETFKYINFPTCMSNCSLDALTESIYYEGGYASEGRTGSCFYGAIDELYGYAAEEGDGEHGDDVSPTMSPVAAATSAPSEIITKSPTMSPVAAATSAPSEITTKSPTMSPVVTATSVPSKITTKSPTMSPMATALTSAPSEITTKSPAVSPVLISASEPSEVTSAGSMSSLPLATTSITLAITGGLAWFTLY